MVETTLFVALDTSKNALDVALAEPLPGGEVRFWGTIANQPAALDRLVKQLQKGGRRLQFCYEAGPCGFGIYRRLNAKAGVTWQVAAPSMIPRRPGDRVKTNRRDAKTLVKLFRAEELTWSWVPDEAHEAMRDLIRARSTAVQSLTRCRQHIRSFLLRQEIRYAGKPWTKKHRVWLGRLEFAAPAHRLMFGEMLGELDQGQARVARLEDHIRELVPTWSLAWLVDAVQALRGYRLIAAVSLVAEIGDPRRFESPRDLMSYLGMVPSEHSTGDKVRRGKLTKTGNRRARKILVEAAWPYARPIKTAAAHPSEAVRMIADKARHRLGRRYRALLARGKIANVAIVAVARESIGFIWAIAHAAAPGATSGQPGEHRHRSALAKVGAGARSSHG